MVDVQGRFCLLPFPALERVSTAITLGTGPQSANLTQGVKFMSETMIAALIFQRRAQSIFER